MGLRLLLKIVITAGLVAAISELGKRSTVMGAILAALPLTSLLALTWLYFDTKSSDEVAGLSMSIFWAVIPSLAFFPIFARLVRTDLPYGVALGLAIAATVALYWLYFLVLKQFGIKL